MSRNHADPLEQRLRTVLAETHPREPRPMAEFELPMRLERFIPNKMLARLSPASVLVPFLRRPDGLRLLLTVRSEDVGSHKGQISFPGGRREPGDADAAAAACREAQEEVGLPPNHVEVIGYLDDYPTVTGFKVTPVVGLVKDVPALRPCEREVAEVFEVPAKWAVDPDQFERKTFRRKGLNLPYHELQWEAYRIWGATAGMLWNLSQKLNGASGS